MTVLVAGGTGALGVAVVGELEASGYDVAATQGDLTEESAARASVEAVADLEAVVNLVGGFAAGPRIHESDPEDLMRMLRLNLVPGYLLARAAMPRLIERGSGAYVGVAARAALDPFPGAFAYAVSKAGVLAFVRSLDKEYRSSGVRANAILPSVIDTPANRRASPDADTSKWVPPEQIAKVVRFLVSEDSEPTSGAAIPVYGLA